MPICKLKTLAKFWAAILTWNHVCLGLVSAQDKPLPSSDEILDQIKEYQTRFSAALEGRIRDDIQNTAVTFQLTLNGRIARYDLHTTPPTCILIYYNDSNVELEEEKEGVTTKLSGKNFERQIEPTGITYEDLALRFLRWPTSTIIGTESIAGHATWKLELRTPSLHSQYTKVIVWVDKDHNCPIKVEGYDAQGHLIRRIQVISIFEIDGETYCKQLRVETLNPTDSKTTSRVYVEITGTIKDEK